MPSFGSRAGRAAIHTAGVFAGALLAVAGPRTLCAQVAATTWAPGPALLSTVTAAVAASWQVDATRVQLDWGRIPPSAPGGVATVSAISPDGQVLVDLSAGNGHRAERLMVRAGVRVPRPVAARPLRRGERLVAGDIATDTAVAWGDPRTAASEAAQHPAAGWRINRYIGAGEPLRPPAVAPPAAVRAGDRVRAVYTFGAISLTFAATAASDAAAGEQVPVRTDDGRRLVGMAEPDGVVRLGGSSR